MWISSGIEMLVMGREMPSDIRREQADFLSSDGFFIGKDFDFLQPGTRQAEKVQQCIPVELESRRLPTREGDRLRNREAFEKPHGGVPCTFIERKFTAFFSRQACRNKSMLHRSGPEIDQFPVLQIQM
jgi:hypothetical protein